MLLKGAKPEVPLKLQIEKDGRVSSCTFTPCGIAPMDESIAALADLLKKTPVPVPPRALIITVKMKIE